MNANKIAYNAIINNAQKSVTGRMNAVIPVEMIAVDPLYQRVEGRNEKKIRRLKNEWDYNLMDALLVVPHPETFNFYVVDGLGRYTVAAEKGIEELDCVIIWGPTDPEERRKFEAKYFLRQADCTEPVKPVQKHNAMIISGDPSALAVKEVTDKYNIPICSTRGRRKEHVLGSYDCVYNIAKINGKEMLEKIFDTLYKAGYMEEVNGLSSKIITPIRRIFESYGDIVTENMMAEFLRKVSPNLLLAKAAAKYSERGWSAMLTLYLQDYVTETLHIPPMFTEDGKKVLPMKKTA